MNILSSFNREMLINNLSLGVGNFLFYADKILENKDRISIYTDKPVTQPDGQSTNCFSLTSLKRTCELLATWYLQAGVSVNDCVAIYMDSNIAYLLHQIALNSIGAIPVYTNGNMDVFTACRYFSNIEIAGIVTDSKHQKDINSFKSMFPNSFIVQHDEIRVQNIDLPEVYPYIHRADSPVLISHTSGTTGFPKAVIQCHRSFFYGISQFLKDPPSFSTDIPYYGKNLYLSVLPTAHNSFLAYCMRAILSCADLMVLTKNDAIAVAEAIEKHKPFIVVAFSPTYQALANINLNNYDLSSLSYWINTGDAAHQIHINQLIKHGHRIVDGKFQEGSIFLDGLGSSEMGSTFFRIAHTPSSQNPLRCVGQPQKWVDAAILDDNGTELAAYQVGKLGVRAPTLSTGYWNNTSLSERSKLSNYWLTGDMAYKDNEGRYYHVDRISDVIHTEKGHLYSILAEEIIFQIIPNLTECAVIGKRIHDGQQEAIAILCFNQETHVHDKTMLDSINTQLSIYNLPPLSNIEITNQTIPVGVTGKALKRYLRDRCTNAITALHNVDLLRDKWGDFISDHTLQIIDNSQFIQKCKNMSLTSNEFKSLLIQHHYYSRHFTRFLCALISNLENANQRLHLLENLAEELGYSEENSVPHSLLYTYMLNRLNISIKHYRPLDLTNALIEKMLSHCRDINPIKGLAALCLGAEAIVPYLYSHICFAGNSLGYSDEDLFFFKLHIECDDGHADSLKEILEEFLKNSPEDKKIVLEIAHDMITHRAELYDTVIRLNTLPSQEEKHVIPS